MEQALVAFMSNPTRGPPFKEMTLEFWIDVKLNTEDHLSYQSRFTRRAIYPIRIKEKNQRKESKEHEHPLKSYRLVYGDGGSADGVLP